MRRLLVAIFVLLACVDRSAVADAVRLHGSSIPLGGCRLLDIKNGRLHFRDASGRRQWRELDQVAALSFDGLPALDEAETRLAAGDTAGGLHKLLQALLDVDRELAEVWVRVRLVRVHDARGEFVQAAGHAAKVFMLREDTYWRYLEPVSEPDEPSYAAALESMDALSEASRSLINGALQVVARRMLKPVRVIHDRLAARAPDLPAGPTLSGVDVEAIRGAGLPAALEPPPVGADLLDEPAGGASEPVTPPLLPEIERPAEPQTEPQTEPRTEPRTEPQTEPDRASPDVATPEAIDAMLAERRFREAVQACQRVAERPGRRRLSRLLHQRGRALAGAGRPRDAAVAFMQGAVLYESSVFAASCLVETAIIYRDEYRRPAVARRLARMALDSAGRDDVAERARRVLATLGADPDDASADEP